MQISVPQARETYDVQMRDGALVRVRRYGVAGAPRIVGSHGNGFAVNGYWPFWSRLEAQFDLLLFDLRNHGWNPRHTRQGHRIHQFVDDLDRLLDIIDAREPAATNIGVFHSVSAITGLVHAIERGWRWDALVAVDPPLMPPPTHALYELAHDFEGQISTWAAGRRERFDAPDTLAAILAGAASRQRWVEGAHALMSHSILRSDGERGGFELCCPGQYESQIYADNAALDICARLAEIDGPLLFACADPDLDDAWPPARVNAAIRQMHGHRYAAIAHTTHMLQVERPEELAALIQGFLTEAGMLPSTRPRGGARRRSPGVD